MSPRTTYLLHQRGDLLRLSQIRVVCHQRPHLCGEPSASSISLRRLGDRLPGGLGAGHPAAASDLLEVARPVMAETYGNRRGRGSNAGTVVQNALRPDSAAGVLGCAAALEQPNDDPEHLGEPGGIRGTLRGRVAAHKLVPILERLVQELVVPVVERPQGQERLEERGGGGPGAGQASCAQSQRPLERRAGGDERRLAVSDVQQLLGGAELVAHAVLTEDLDVYARLNGRGG